MAQDDCGFPGSVGDTHAHRGCLSPRSISLWFNRSKAPGPRLGKGSGTEALQPTWGRPPKYQVRLCSSLRRAHSTRTFFTSPLLWIAVRRAQSTTSGEEGGDFSDCFYRSDLSEERHLEVHGLSQHDRSDRQGQPDAAPQRRLGYLVADPGRVVVVPEGWHQRGMVSPSSFSAPCANYARSPTRT